MAQIKHIAIRTHDVDSLVQQVAVQLTNLLLRDLDLFQAGSDLLERQNALLLPFRDQATELFHLEDGGLVGQQYLSLGAQAIPRSR